MRVQFQSGRNYTVHGQRIIAETCSEGILFNDIDRGVNGLIVCIPPRDRLDVKNVTMTMYDCCLYKWDERAQQLNWEN
jgi:hypothetical protein